MKKSSHILLAFLLVGAFSYAFHLFSKPESRIKEKLSESTVNGKIILPSNLLDVHGNVVSSEEIEGKYIGLYFSASWCGPCRSFTPKLIKFKEEHNANFEVILIGSDGSAKAQANYMKKYKMPWLALKNQSDAARGLSQALDVEYIPYLVVLNPDGEVVTKNGKADIARLGLSAFSAWKELEE